jgi:hypothetical protein
MPGRTGLSALWRACRVAAWIVAAAWLACSLRACADTVVTLKEAAEIDSERIELGALATVTAPEADKQMLQMLDVGPAPLPGRSRVLTLGYLKMRMRRWGVDPESVVFAGAAGVEVSRPAPIALPAAPDAEQVSPDPVAPAPEPQVVKRGAKLQLVVVCGAVRVVAEAQTLEDGQVGQPVKMRVEQTRQTVWGTLASATTATLVL